MKAGPSMTGDRKRFVVELVLTGIAAPIVIWLVFVLRVVRGLFWIALPVLYLGQAITVLIERMFPPQGGGWFTGLGTALIVDFVLVWIAVWMVLFVLVRLIEKLINRKKREA
jgi:cytosine/uracil/thiamine/allantoin permease